MISIPPTKPAPTKPAPAAHHPARSSPSPDHDSIDQEILSRLDLRREYELLGFEITAEHPSKYECRARNREDSSPSATIFRDTGNYHDSVEGGSISLWDAAAQYGPYPTWQLARQGYADQVGVDTGFGGGSGKSRPSGGYLAGVGGVPRNAPATTTTTSTPTTPTPKQKLSPPRKIDGAITWDKQFNPALAKLWTRHKPGIHPDSLQPNGCRLGQYMRGELARRIIAIPAYDPAQSNPLDHQPVGYQFYDRNGGKLPKYKRGTLGKGKTPEVEEWLKVKSIGTAGIMGEEGLRALLTATPEQSIEVCWLVEGGTDLLATYSAIAAQDAELNSTHITLANMGGSTQSAEIFSLLFAPRIVDRSIISLRIVRDADLAGRRGAAAWVAALRVAVVYFGGSEELASEAVVWSQLPFEEREKHGEDVRDYFTN